MPCDRTDDYTTAGSGATRQSGSTGLGEQCKPTRHGMRWVFIILTSRSFFLGESGPLLFWGQATNSNQLAFFCSNDTSGEDRYGFESE